MSFGHIAQVSRSRHSYQRQQQQQQQVPFLRQGSQGRDYNNNMKERKEPITTTSYSVSNDSDTNKTTRLDDYKTNLVPRLEKDMIVPKNNNNNNSPYEAPLSLMESPCKEFKHDGKDEKKNDTHDRVSPTCVVSTWEDDDDEEDEEEEDDNNDNKDKVATFATTANKVVTDLEAELREAANRRQRLQENLRKQRAQCKALQGELAAAQAALATATASHSAQHDDLCQALERLSATRDAVKRRWKIQVAVNKQLHEDLAVERARWRREEARRSKEAQLLDLYRKLSKVTGYQNLGKEIRTTEAELAAWNDTNRGK